MNYPKHIVATASLVRNQDGQVLLVKTERRDWEIPGGQVEKGESVVSALEREVEEESGVSIKIKKLSAFYSSIDEPSKIIIDFISEHKGGIPKKDNEIIDVGWFSPEDAVVKVTHDVMNYRLRWLLKNNDGVRYSSYSKGPFVVVSEIVFNKNTPA